jgi:hypothetical protein
MTTTPEPQQAPPLRSVPEPDVDFTLTAIERDLSKPAPDGGRHHERTFTEFTCTIVFTAVEVWAVLVVLFRVPADGVARVALAAALAGTLMAVLLSWQDRRR